MIEIRPFSPRDERYQAILRRAESADREVWESVREIVDAVRERGDEALAEFSLRFDGVNLVTHPLAVREEEFLEAGRKVSDDFLIAIAQARTNIRRFHEYQKRSGYVHDDGDGVLLSKRVSPLRRAGVCCPAKSAPLFSSLLMNVVPAQVAGVPEIAVIVPPRADGSVDPHILAAARLLGVSRLFRVGGAHGVAALAYGTATIPRVDKIVGPGNIYVATAKKLVFGAVGIDSVAGPSEIVILCDNRADPAFVAADLLSQVEHGTGLESGVVFTDSREMAEAIRAEVVEQTKLLPTARAIAASFARYGAIFVVQHLDEAVAAANELAPEHLEILTRDPAALADGMRNAGALFLGPWSPEPVGDYFCGTNHVLPTGGAARYASSLGVGDFLKDTSVVQYSASRLARTGRFIARMAEIEGLEAHANAIRVRLRKLPEPDGAP